VFPVVTSDNQLMYPSPSPASSQVGRSDAFGMPVLVTPGDAADAFLSMPHNAGQAAAGAKEKISLETGIATGERALTPLTMVTSFVQFAAEREFDSIFADRELTLSRAFTSCLHLL
jgi:hypothetical protein